MKTIITLDDEKFGGKYYHTAHVELVQKDGIHMAKYVDIDQLLKALIGAEFKKERFHRIGALPQNYFDGALWRDAEEEINGKIIITIPKCKITTTFEKTRYSIPFPALLFYFWIVKGKILDTQVYALKGRKWDMESNLYNYPFGNVNTHTHSVCWGKNSLPKITDLRKLDVICSLFYSSPTNNDYYSVGRSTKWKMDNLRNVFEKIKDMEEFPEEGLVMSDIGNIGNIVNDFNK